MYVCIDICMHVSTCTTSHVHADELRVCVYMYVCAFVCTYVYMRCMCVQEHAIDV